MQNANKMYVLHRIINNNVIAALDRKDNEVVLMGKGIAFGKKVGEKIDVTTIEKVFILNDKSKKIYFDRIAGIGDVYFEIAIEIFRNAEKEYPEKLNPLGILMVADHISDAVERYKSGIHVGNALLLDIRRYYLKEYECGLYGIELVKQKAGVTLSEDEAGFIALHIINSEGNEYRQKNAQESLKIINEVFDIVEAYFEIQLDKQSLYYDRFMVHLKYFSNRLLLEKTGSLKDDFIYRMMKIQFPETAKCVEIIATQIEFKHQLKISNEEKGYLMIHIGNLIKTVR